MTPAAIAFCLGFASLALAAAAGSVVIAAVEHLTRLGWWARLGVRTRAGLLAQARLAPLSVTVVFTPLVQLAFWSFEPRSGSESIGIALPALAAVGVALTTLVAVRGWRTARATTEVARTWRNAAAPAAVRGWDGPAWVVQTPFPVVAVVGVRRAELFVSADVLSTCSEPEMEAVAAHERAHVAEHDNLLRMLVALTPAFGPAVGRLERVWDATMEEAADLQARAGGKGAILARALTKVARLAVASAEASPLAMSAFLGRGSLEARVLRLLEPPGRPGRPLRGLTMAALPLTVAAAVSGLPAIYEAAEFLVRLGR
ncbi:MAG: M48 family metalloprotease [Vicinamibacterales bacterium]